MLHLKNLLWHIFPEHMAADDLHMDVIFIFVVKATLLSKSGTLFILIINPGK